VRTCPRCGRQTPEGRDFCECGEYLRWEPTEYRQTVERTPANPSADEDEQATPLAAPESEAPVVSGPTVAPPSRSAASVGPTLLLRLPDGENAEPGSLTVTADPGGHTAVLGLVRNESTVVDNYDLAIRGLPDDWWTMAPPVSYLVPFGASGAYEQEFQAHLHPPRAPHAYARAWPFEVVATSRTYPATAATVPATLIVTPYSDISTEVKPDRVTGRWRARYSLTAANGGNAATDVAVRGEDTDGRCRFRFPQRVLTVPAGQQAAMRFSVRPPRQIWVGRPVERQLSISTTPVGLDKSQPPMHAIFRQRAWLPRWFVILLVILILLAALAVAAVIVVPKLEKHHHPSHSASAASSLAMRSRSAVRQ
jgi:hypothetical protein